MVTLNVTKRDNTTKTDVLRKAGLIPAVFYGKKETSTPIVMKEADFNKVWKEAGESTVVVLDVEGVDKVEALIHDVSFDPVTDKTTHVDFYAFEKGKKIEVPVELEFIGIAPAIRDLGGILVKVLHELNVQAVPSQLPHGLTVDIGALVTFDSVIKAKDLVLPEGVELVDDSEEVIASISVPKEEPEEPVAPVDLSQIEVEKKGKEEVAEGEGEADAKAGASK